MPDQYLLSGMPFLMTLKMEQTLINKETKGIIFDLDGTLIDSMPLHFVVWSKTAEHYGFPLSHETFHQYAGMSTLKILETVKTAYHLDFDLAEARAFKSKLYLDRISEVEKIEPIFGLAQSLVGKMPMTVGTGSGRHSALRAFEVMKMENWFDGLVSADDVINGKPNPETFLKCAEIMGIEPQYCQVFEDGDPGIKAALEVGMMVTDVRELKLTTSPVG